MKSVRVLLGTKVANATNSPTIVGQSALTQQAPLTPKAALMRNPAQEVHLAMEDPHMSQIQATYSYPSRTSNAPRLTDSSYFKQIIPFQKTGWSPTAEEMQEDGVAERPQTELAVMCARDVVTAIPKQVIEMEDAAKRTWESDSTATTLWKKLRRAGRRLRYGKEGLLVRDETFWRWWVEDNYGFRGKPAHCTWEQFEEELRSFSFHFELHPSKPEDYYILHILRKDTSGFSEVVWSAEQAAWQGPALSDMYAALGTMMARRLKTRTLSFDNGRGTVSELNLRHVGPYTSAVHVNARPPYYYDAHLREKREETASWYFTKEMIQNPGIDEEGTVSFYVSAEALSYHLCSAVAALLRRPLAMFYRKSRRRSAQHRHNSRTAGVKATYMAERWMGMSSEAHSPFPQENPLDAVTENWFEESPFPLTMMHSRIRSLAKLKPQNLERQQFVQGNVTVTKEAARSLIAGAAPSLLAEGSALQRMLAEPHALERARVYMPLDAEALEKLKLLRESDTARAEEQRVAEEALQGKKAAEALEAAEKRKARELASGSEEDKGRVKAAKRVKDGISGAAASDSEGWEWLHQAAEETVNIRHSKKRLRKQQDESLGAVEL